MPKVSSFRRFFFASFIDIGEITGRFRLYKQERTFGGPRFDDNVYWNIYMNIARRIHPSSDRHAISESARQHVFRFSKFFCLNGTVSSFD